MITLIIVAAGISLAFISSDTTDSKSGNSATRAAKFTLPSLPYGLSDLEPVISCRTMNLHYNKHFQGYINNLNRLIEGTRYEFMSIEEIIRESEGAVFNNAGQTLNHTIYFLSFSPAGGGEPTGDLGRAIKAQWGTFDAFKKEFSDTAINLFGSGWAWLSKDADGKLVITAEKDGSNPVVHGLTPILGFDVWEHSYYLDYENRRADHINAIWQILDWQAIGARY